MKLTNYIKDLGRVVAFYPNLKKVTGSTTASILLCQFLYWTDKTKDGWIYKNHYELEEETGLSYYEQKGARKILVDLGILFEQFKRWDRTNAYYINQKKLNELWETANGREIEPVTDEKVSGQISLPIEEQPIPINQPVDLRDFQNPELHPEHPAHRSDVEKKGDLVDAIIDLSREPGVIKENIKNQIRNKISTKLHINIDALKWEKFIDYVYIRQEKYNEPVEKFISWTIENNPDSRYWTPDRMMMLYPQAFITEEKPQKSFVEPLPERKEEDYVDMPEELRTKKKLY